MDQKCFNTLRFYAGSIGWMKSHIDQPNRL